MIYQLSKCNRLLNLFIFVYYESIFLIIYNYYLKMKIFEPKQINFSRRIITQHNIFQEKWPIISNFIINLIKFNQLNNPSGVQYIVQELCLRNYEKQISSNLTIVFYNIFNNFLQKIEKNDLINNILVFYKRLVVNLQLISELFQYFQATYLIQKQQKCIRRLALNIFHNQISNQHLIEEQIIEHVLTVLENYREEVYNLDENKISLINMVIELGMFKKSIEAEFIQKSKNYYQQKRLRLPNNIDFLNFIDKEIQKETIIKKYVNPNEDIIKVIEKQLIIQNLDLMIGYFEYLVNQDKFLQLKLLWKFFSQVDQVQLINKKLEELINDYEKYLEEIQKIILFKRKLVEIVEACFQANKNLMIFVENCFQDLFSKKSTQCNSIMSKYFIDIYANHYMMQEYKEDLPFQMFKSNPSKDILVVQYQNKLAQYILNNNQFDLTRHVLLIQKIKDFCGVSMIKNLELMIHDVWRNSHMVIYQHENFKCKLLSKNYWPRLQNRALNLPDELRIVRDQFEKEYESKHFNRKLWWIYSLGSFEFEINKVKFILSQIQASIIIYLAKSIRPMKRDQLINVLKVPANQVSNQLEDLKKNGIVIQNSNSQSYQLYLQENTPYQYLKKFQLQKSQSIQILNDRNLTVDACLMRLLKFKKVMLQPDLIKHFPKMVKIFKPTIQQINNSLTRLQQKQFIEINGHQIKYIP